MTNEEEVLKSWGKLVGVVFLAALGGNYGINQLNPPRPDPFTGTEGKVLDSRLKRLEQVVEAHILWSQTKREEIYKNDVVQTSLLNEISHDQKEIIEDVKSIKNRLRELEKR